MNHCEEFQALLDLFLDGELAPEEMARVQEHLNACPACRDYVGDMLTIRAAFSSVDSTEVPEGFAEGVMERIRAETPRRTTVSFRRRWMGAAAALAACCAIVVFLRTAGPASMGGGAAVTADDARQQIESVAEAAYDAAAGENVEEMADEAGMDAGGPVGKNETEYTAGAFPESAPDSKADNAAAQTAANESQARSGDMKSYTARDVEQWTDEERPAEAAGDSAFAGENSGVAEDREEAYAPEMPVAAAPPEPAASAKTEEPDLTLSSGEAGGLLDAFAPIEDRGTERIYLLTREEFAALLEKLPEEYKQNQESGKEIMTVLVTAA